MPVSQFCVYGVDVVADSKGLVVLLESHNVTKSLGNYFFRDNVSYWAEETTVFLDVVVLRYLSREKGAGFGFGTSTHAFDNVASQAQASAETGTPDAGVLLFDRRALRNKDALSATQITIAGKRFVGKWALTKISVVGPSVATTDCVIIPSPVAFVILLPVQGVFVPLYWRECPSFGSKKEVFGLKHIMPGGPAGGTAFTFNLVSSALLEVTVQETLKLVFEGTYAKDRKLALPMLYPPAIPQSADVRVVTEEDEGKRLALVESAVKVRIENVKTQMRTLRSGGGQKKQIAKNEQFTMRFLSNALEIDADVADVLGDEEDEEVAVAE